MRETVQHPTATQRAIERWSRMYRQGREQGNARLRLPAAIAGELARLATCELEGGVTGGERAEYLQRQYSRVQGQLRRWAERGFAGGGMVLKPYLSGGELLVECIAQDCFVPLAWSSNGEITAAEFCEHTFIKGERYRRIERHRLLEGGRYEITHRVLDGSGREVTVGLPPQWTQLPAVAVLEGIDRPLFAYFRTPMENLAEPESPLGVAVFAGAAELIEQAEQQWERIEWEYRGGELAIDASEDLFEHRRDGSLVLPQGKERLFRAHDIDIGQSGGRFLEVFAPMLRDEALFNGLNNMLRRVEFNCGLAYGTLSDLSEVERTAQEVKTSKQRSYATVCELQAALEKALRELVQVLDTWATLAGLCPAGGYTLRLCWGDSVVTDSETLREHHRKDVAAGLMTVEEYRAWWHGGREVAADD